jgi:hypothetical protein
MLRESGLPDDEGAAPVRVAAFISLDGDYRASAPLMSRIAALRRCS